MHHGNRLATIAASLLLGGSLLAAGAPASAQATEPGAVTVRQAHRAVHMAERAAVRAQARLREARHVESATRCYSGLYGARVAGWVFAARRAGYAWWEMPILMRVVDRESGGDPSASNGGVYIGILQVGAEWADGSKAWYWKPLGLPALWSRASAWESLRHGAHMAWGNWGE